MTGFDVDRFRAYQADESYRSARTTEILGTVYAAHTPGKQLRSARGAKLSPVHDRLVEAAGYLREVSGWEGADWFAGPGVTPEAEPTWGRAPWFEQWEAEHRAIRERVGLMDMSLHVEVPRHRRRCRARCSTTCPAARSTASPSGSPTPSGSTTPATIEADLTVTKLAEDDFWVVASDTAHGHALARMRRHAGDADVTIDDVTAEYAQLNVQGPRSRDLLATLTDADLSTEAFPFRTARWVTLAGCQVLCVRITYVGELGYELYLPAADALDRVRRPGRRRGLGLARSGSSRWRACGWRRPTATSATTSTTPTGCWRSGSASRVDLDKPSFIGRMRCSRRRRRLADPPAGAGAADRPRAAAVPRRAGLPRRQVVGYIRAASYGWTLGGAVGLAMLDAGETLNADWLKAGEWTVDIAGTAYAAEVSLRPMYDPTNARINV